ncbi:hypothetical protein AB0J72_03410 [Dactylosporangium sp. NPDC049742]|uniref:hypothetical protein n=1 Tax=Dactylosporangium sp. NPDC049742 TaxID=3154737 RepID=UPI00341214A0
MVNARICGLYSIDGARLAHKWISDLWVDRATSMAKRGLFGVLTNVCVGAMSSHAPWMCRRIVPRDASVGVRAVARVSSVVPGDAVAGSAKVCWLACPALY